MDNASQAAQFVCYLMAVPKLLRFVVLMVIVNRIQQSAPLLIPQEIPLNVQTGPGLLLSQIALV
jgi:hypothetical protein